MLTKKAEMLASENPFYGLKELLNAFQQLPKLTNPTTANVTILLNAADKEINAITDPTRKKLAREMLYVIIFKIGDISNRQHIMFGKNKVDGGGDSLRKAFRYSLDWLVRTHEKQFYDFLPLIPEYTNFENTFFYQLKTDRYKGKIEETEKIAVDHEKVAEYLSKLIKDASVSKFQKALIAKFLPKVPTAKRYKKDKTGKTVSRNKQRATLDKDKAMLRLIASLSFKMQWPVTEVTPEEGKAYTRYVGYEAFRSEHLQLTEAYLFSTHKIKEFDSTQFTEWLDSLPSGARFRVQCRICDKSTTGALTAKDKWINNGGKNLGALYITWLKSKELALKKLLSLSDDEKKEMTTKELHTLQKSAKVNTGAETLFQALSEFMKNKQTNTAMADLKAHAILEKVKIEVPVLIGFDVSNSMNTSNIILDGVRYSPREIGLLALAVFLAKNPDEDGQDIAMLFTDQAKIIIGGKNTAVVKKNKFVTGVTTTVDGNLYDKSKTFTQNYANLRAIIEKNAIPHSTHLTCLSKELKRWVDEDLTLKSMKIEMIQQHAVWLLISDGDINNSRDATASMAQFQADLRNWFQYEPVIVVWDVKAATLEQEHSKFAGLPNVMYFGGFNYQVLNQIFVNINDIDIIDTFLPLKALHASNRYNPVKELTL
jgi:hypothetical protein